MLEAQGQYNQLSPQLRDELEKAVENAGKMVKFKFAIARQNPDGEQRAHGKLIYPQQWALTPVTFQLVDPYDKKLKTIGLVLELQERGAQSDKLRRVVLQEAWQGLYKLDMSRADDKEVFAYLWLHPKLENGKFRDTEQPPIIKYIDEIAAARSNMTSRQSRVNAMYVASNMTSQEVRDFACASSWNEFEEEVLLRERIEELADKDPEFFREFIDNKNIEYRAVLQRAMDNNIIAFLPVESKFVWVTNGQAIAVLERTDSGNVLERMTDWVMTSKNGMEVFAKIKSFLTEKAKASVNK